MQLIPVKTRILQPPQDDLFSVLDEYLTDVQEGDVVLVSSKIVAISEGRTVKHDEVDKQVLVEQEADLLIPRSYWGSPLTIIRSAFIGTAGIDESNSGEYLVLLPEDAFKSAREIHTYVKTGLLLPMWVWSLPTATRNPCDVGRCVCQLVSGGLSQ